MRLRATTNRSRFPRYLGTSAVLAAIGLFGCYDSEPNPAEPDPQDSGVSGSHAEPSPTGEAGAASGGREAEVEPPTSGIGGSEPEHSSGSGGTTAAAGSPAMGGSSAGSPAEGGSPAEEGGAPAGGSDPIGGTTSEGGTAQGGTGGVEEPPLESICVDESGSPVPYDHSFGLASEYAFELSMSCSVGGYVMPLVLADPVDLSQVTRFVSEATEWYRAKILRCDGEQSALGEDAYGLLPVAESSELSGGDFDASLDLFLSVIDRHDGQPDEVSGKKKGHIKQRIKSIRARAVKRDTADLTRTLSEPDCIPALPPEEAG